MSGLGLMGAETYRAHGWSANRSWGESATPPGLGIPKGWERVAPGRAKHAPGERGVRKGDAPRQGCEGMGRLQPLRRGDSPGATG